MGATPVPKGFHFISCLLLILIRISKQGHTASLTHRVQRSYGLGWDIRADHPDVPAFYFPIWHRAKPRTLLTTLFVFDDFYMYSTRLSQSGHMFIWTSQLVRTEHSCRRMRTEHLMLPLFFHCILDGLGFLVWCRCHDRCIPSEFAKLFQFKCERNSDPSQQQVS